MMNTLYLIWYIYLSNNSTKYSCEHKGNFDNARSRKIVVAVIDGLNFLILSVLNNVQYDVSNWAVLTQ